MISKFKFQVFPSNQERKTNLSVCFLGEVKAGQFLFEIYRPLTISDYIQYPCLNIISADISCKSDCNIENDYEFESTEDCNFATNEL